jgi:hypothetical protein
VIAYIAGDWSLLVLELGIGFRLGDREMRAKSSRNKRMRI